MKTYKHKYTDLETEPDYPVTLTCKWCNAKQTVSGQEIEFLEIDVKDFICEDCI